MSVFQLALLLALEINVVVALFVQNANVLASRWRIDAVHLFEGFASGEFNAVKLVAICETIPLRILLCYIFGTFQPHTHTHTHTPHLTSPHLLPHKHDYLLKSFRLVGIVGLH